MNRDLGINTNPPSHQSSEAPRSAQIGQPTIIKSPSNNLQAELHAISEKDPGETNLKRLLRRFNSFKEYRAVINNEEIVNRQANVIRALFEKFSANQSRETAKAIFIHLRKCLSNQKKLVQSDHSLKERESGFAMIEPFRAELEEIALWLDTQGKTNRYIHAFNYSIRNLKQAIWKIPAEERGELTMSFSRNKELSPRTISSKIDYKEEPAEKATTVVPVNTTGIRGPVLDLNRKPISVKHPELVRENGEGPSRVQIRLEARAKEKEAKAKKTVESQAGSSRYTKKLKTPVDPELKTLSDDFRDFDKESKAVLEIINHYYQLTPFKPSIEIGDLDENRLDRTIEATYSLLKPSEGKFGNIIKPRILELEQDDQIALIQRFNALYVRFSDKSLLKATLSEPRLSNFSQSLSRQARDFITVYEDFTRSSFADELNYLAKEEIAKLNQETRVAKTTVELCNQIFAYKETLSQTSEASIDRESFILESNRKLEEVNKQFEELLEMSSIAEANPGTMLTLVNLSKELSKTFIENKLPEQISGMEISKEFNQDPSPEEEALLLHRSLERNFITNMHLLYNKLMNSTVVDPELYGTVKKSSKTINKLSKNPDVLHREAASNQPHFGGYDLILRQYIENNLELIGFFAMRALYDCQPKKVSRYQARHKNDVQFYPGAEASKISKKMIQDLKARDLCNIFRDLSVASDIDQDLKDLFKELSLIIDIISAHPSTRTREEFRKEVPIIQSIMQDYYLLTQGKVSEKNQAAIDSLTLSKFLENNPIIHGIKKDKPEDEGGLQFIEHQLYLAGKAPRISQSTSA